MGVCDMADVTNLPAPLRSDFNAWLEAEIQRLSLDALPSDVVTCTACGEMLGSYIVEHQGTSLRLSAMEAYSFLEFMVSRL